MRYNNVEKGIVAPFLKWAGGKRWLAKQYTKFFPENYNRYIEPFLGSGALYFFLQPNEAILADTNARLIETYTQIRDKPQYIKKLLKHHQKKHSDTYYYEERERDYPRSAAQRAAQLIYLNRTCWNGLYRVNKNGKFNVPRGTKSSVVLDTDNFEAISDLLKSAKLYAQDFSETLSCAGEGDFVYIDPPYTVRHNFNGFAKYNERMFSWEDQIRLRDEVAATIDRGAMVAVSNADHESLSQLYQDLGIHYKISRESVIAAKSQYRGIVGEILITSWKT